MDIFVAKKSVTTRTHQAHLKMTLMSWKNKNPGVKLVDSRILSKLSKDYVPLDTFDSAGLIAWSFVAIGPVSVAPVVCRNATARLISS